MIKQALSEYHSKSVSSSFSSVNGKNKAAISAEEERRKNGKGVRMRYKDTDRTPAVLSIEKVASDDNLSIFCHVDATDWCPPSEVVKKISCFFTKPVRVEIYPRYMVGEVWSKDHGGADYKKDYYAFRAYAGKDYCKIFVDETETKDSALWVLLHELAHISLASAPYIFKGFRHLTPKDYFESDEAHERDPEEQMANSMAVSWLGMLGYEPKNYPRHWWRERTIMNSKGVEKAASVVSISPYAVLRMYANTGRSR